MNNLIDKIIIFFISLSLYIQNSNDNYLVIPILITVFLSSIISYKENEKLLITVFISFIVLCFLNPMFIYFAPLFCYDLFFYRIKWLWAIALLPIFSSPINELSQIFIFTFIFIGFILKYRTQSFESIKKNYYKVSDNAKELSTKFEKKNRELLEKQDYEINLATLRERNRIARDIHDNVGHLLSRCLLQIGALLAINKDEVIGDNLSLIKDTLSEAMDSIRSSVHDLHEDAIDLQVEIQQLVDSFEFCPITFDCDMDSSPDKKLKYCFITITKEALSNIIKHSNATNVSVIICEHPALYQLVIKDNGSKVDYNIENGIGIKNIIDRVSSLGGSSNISSDNGFRIFISIPKTLERIN